MLTQNFLERSYEPAITMSNGNSGQPDQQNISDVTNGLMKLGKGIIPPKSSERLVVSHLKISNPISFPAVSALLKEW